MPMSVLFGTSTPIYMTTNLLRYLSIVSLQISGIVKYNSYELAPGIKWDVPSSRGSHDQIYVRHFAI